MLLSDGRNQVVANSEVTESDYTSYGYLADGRMGTHQQLPDRRAERRREGRARLRGDQGKGIRVYTILFQVDFEKTQDLFRNCASKDDKGEPLYYYVPDASQLETAFAEIGEDLTTLRDRPLDFAPRASARNFRPGFRPASLFIR